MKIAIVHSFFACIAAGILTRAAANADLVEATAVDETGDINMIDLRFLANTSGTAATAQCQGFLAQFEQNLPSGITGCTCKDAVNITCSECDFTINQQTGVLIPTARLTQAGGVFESCADLVSPDSPELCLTASFDPQSIQNTTCSATYAGQDCNSCAIDFCTTGGFGNNKFGFDLDCSNVGGGRAESTCANITLDNPFSVVLHAVYEAENHKLECHSPNQTNTSSPSSAWSPFHNKGMSVVGLLTAAISAGYHMLA
ncbi:hypothetical protein ACA910_015687 [Epithemia clementina (nom. ined.)]